MLSSSGFGAERRGPHSYTMDAPLLVSPSSHAPALPPDECRVRSLFVVRIDSLPPWNCGNFRRFPPVPIQIRSSCPPLSFEYSLISLLRDFCNLFFYFSDDRFPAWTTFVSFIRFPFFFFLFSGSDTTVSPFN